MKIIICSDVKKTEDLFSFLTKNKNHDVVFFPASDYRKVLKDAPKMSLFYLDLSKFDDSVLSKEVNYLLKQEDVFTALIDSKGKIADIASLFHKGLVDYIGKALYTGNSGIDARRINTVEEYIKKGCPEAEQSAILYDIDEKMIVRKDWSNVKPGTEYTFLFLHLFFDNYYEIEKTYGRAHVLKMVNKFKDYLSHVVSPYGGKVWMWMEASGLVLFPFDGKSCDIIELGYKLVLNRHIINLENGFRNPLSYRLSAHIGNTTYQETGDTGTIVSESINTIFHLGNKFTTPGGFFMTPEVASFIPERASHMFFEIGEYEGRMITRMKMPVNM